MRKGVLILIMSGLALAGFAGDAQATSFTTVCPGTPGGGDREFTIIIDASSPATCGPYGPGNINGDGDAINNWGGTDNWTTLDKSDDAITGLYPVALTITGTGSGPGTFSFDPSIWLSWGQIIIAFKSGEGQYDPDWASFVLPNGVSSGTWQISSQGLSHANLYGTDYEELQQLPVPEPATLALLGLGLAVGARRLRRKV